MYNVYQTTTIPVSWIQLCALRRYTSVALVHQWTPADKGSAPYLAAHPYAASVPDLVVHLARQLGSTGNTVVLDSYFAYQSTVRGLLDAGFNVVGSLKKTSVPCWDIMWDKKETKLPFGSCRGLRSRCGQMAIQQWKDTRVVSIITTVHAVISGSPAAVEAMGRGKQAPVVRRKKDKTGCYERKEGVRPTTTSFYSEFMRYAEISTALFSHAYISLALQCLLVCCADPLPIYCTSVSAAYLA